MMHVNPFDVRTVIWVTAHQCRREVRWRSPRIQDLPPNGILTKDNSSERGRMNWSYESCSTVVRFATQDAARRGGVHAGGTRHDCGPVGARRERIGAWGT